MASQVKPDTPRALSEGPQPSDLRKRKLELARETWKHLRKPRITAGQRGVGRAHQGSFGPLETMILARVNVRAKMRATVKPIGSQAPRPADHG